jgi:tetratricopeptide (TPR) repeat protein
MASLIEGFSYDIFISYRQKDNKGDRWVSEFVEALKTELESTFKEEVSVYFDINPHDGLLETHDVGASLKEKLKCLIFIPIISRTYCDPKSFAWEYEFRAFVEQASQDQFGLKVKLPNGNVANRILPVRIHDLDNDDIKLCESILGGFLRGVEFIYKEPGANKPLTPEDDEKKNINNTKYRIQINKVALAMKEIILGLKTPPILEAKEKAQHKEPLDQVNTEEQEIKKEKPPTRDKSKMLSGIAIMAILIIAAILAYPKIFRHDKFEDIKDPDGRISVAVMPFKNLTGDSLYNKWQDGFQTLLISNLSNTKELSVRSFETMLDIIGSTGHMNYASITPTVANEIALKLESGTVISGSLSKAGGNFRISVQLMKAESSEIYKAFALDFKEEDRFMIMTDSLSGLLKNFLRIEIMKLEGLAEFDQFTNTTSPEAYLSFVQAMKMMFNNNNSAAGEYFLKAVKIDSNFTNCYYFLALGYQMSGDHQKAEATFNMEGRDKLSFRDQQFWDHLKYGYMEKNPQKGIQILLQLAEKEPQNRFILNNIGDLNRLMHNYDKEIEAYEKYIEIDARWGVTSKWIWPYVELGDAYHIKGNHKREAVLYNEALQMRPDYQGVIYRQARCALSLEDTLIAGGFITKLLSIYREQSGYTESQLKSVLGNLYSDAGILDKAELNFRQALGLSPKNPIRIRDLAWFLIKKGIDLEEGIELANEALELRPDNYNFQYTKGLGLLKKGNYSEALGLLEKSWTQRPGYDYDHYLTIQEAKKAITGHK